MDLTPAFLDRLRRLRGGFLEAGSTRRLPDYWRETADLEAYDQVYAARIGWKWEAALDELSARDLLPQPRSLLDFGCGTGIASRRLLERVEVEQILLFDRSPLARDFAAEAIAASHPGIPIRICRSIAEVQASSFDLLLCSHLLNELDPRAEEALCSLVRSSPETIWLESGTKANARRLAALRDRLQTDLHCLAPCPHQLPCPSLQPDSGHWCHFFARPPEGLLADGSWVRLGRQLGIDLRALPYSYLYLRADPALQTDPTHRLLGRPQVRKKEARVWSCEQGEILERRLFKNSDPEAFRALKKQGSSLRWLPGT